MKRSIKLFVALLVCGLLNQSVLHASSHREAPLISNDPLADNTDVYAFRSPGDSSKVVLIANYIPFEHPAGGPNWYNFGSNIRYEIHVKNNASTMGDDITYRFTFQSTNQDPTTFFNIRLGAQNIKTTYTLEKGIAGVFSTIITNGVVPPNNIGPRSIESGVGLNAPNYDTVMNRAITMATGTGGEKVFAGPIDDPFFVDLGGAFDLGGFRKTGRDGLAKMNCHSLVIEVPISTLQKSHLGTASATSILDPNFVIGVYASASRTSMTTFDSTGAAAAPGGTWVQVSRLGMPLTNEVVIPIGMKDKWNATATNSPDELSFAGNFTNPELALYMDDSQFGGAVPGLKDLRIQTNSLGSFDFRNGKQGLYPLKGNPALAGTAFDPATYGNILLPDNHSPRSVDLLPIFYTGVPNLVPYQLATGKTGGPLSAGKPFINNFLPTLGDMLRLNMAVPVTPRNSADFNSLGLVYAAVLGLTDSRFTASGTALQNIPNMDGFPNGRRLEDDVTTIELQAVSGVVLAAVGLWYDDYVAGGSPVTPQLLKVLGFNAGVTKNDTTFKTVFPYVQAPWRGFVGASYVGPVNPITSNIPTAFTTCPATNLAIARPGYNAYNGEPMTIYNVDTTTGLSTPIAGGPLKDFYTGKNMDVNGVGLNSKDGFLYAMRKDTLNGNSIATLYRIGSNYGNTVLGTIQPPPLNYGQLSMVNPSAGTFDDQGNYYITGFSGYIGSAPNTFLPHTFYIGKISNAAALQFLNGATITPTWTQLNTSNVACASFIYNTEYSFTASGVNAGSFFQDITYSNVYRSLFMYNIFPAGQGSNTFYGGLISIVPSTGVVTCYPTTTPMGATNNEVAGISTTTNGGLRVLLTSGDIYKSVAAADGSYTGVIMKLGASGIPMLGVTGSMRGDLASCGFGPLSLPASNTSIFVSGGAVLTNSITAYPNPVRGLTTVAVQQALNNASIRVMGVSGNVVSTQAGVSGTTFRVDLTNKPSGLYIVEILQGGNTTKVKLLKQ